MMASTPHQSYEWVRKTTDCGLSHAVNIGHSLMHHIRMASGVSHAVRSSVVAAIPVAGAMRARRYYKFRNLELTERLLSFSIIRPMYLVKG